MSQTELLHWCSAYHAAPAPDEESEIVAQFLAAPYPYQNDDDQDQKQLGDDIRATSAYWPDHVTDPSGAGACYWAPNADSSNGQDRNAGSGGGYVDDDGGCYYYLGEPDVSLGINTRATLPCTSIDLNLLGDGEEERAACVQPVADHIRVDHLDGGNDGAAVSRPKRKVPGGRDGGDLGGHKKKKASASKTAQKCVQEKPQSSSSCSGNESICSEAHVGGGGVKTRASKGSATDPQSLYARKRRERINERLKILQKLVPNGTKVDISTMLEEAVQYVRFLQLQIKMLSSDETWMYAPIAYNGMSLGIDLKISPPQ
ncbi:hypothetical protein QOZ80_3BG0259990 [Eleusine coracana subsp. coracana]|nr:hypothetical protein QOZ80_3BG0259990 [Eleusine coracana subsp. coracana]